MLAPDLDAGTAPVVGPAPVFEPVQRQRLADCYRACGAIAREHSKTFYLSSLFLRPAQRRGVWAVYAFCRTADDIVDRIAPAQERLDAIGAWERKLLDAYDGRASDPIFAAFADAARRFAIPVQPALDLLRGARMDVTIRRYATYGELSEYCYLVASTVGLLVMPILGTLSPEALGYGVALGRAMQMTNILRDVGEDARMGRIYLPAEDRLRFGCEDGAILAGVVDEPFVALMRFQIARVRAMYADAEPGIAMLAPESRYTVRLALSLYREILDRIEANGFDVFTRRAFVPLRAKLLTALAVAVPGAAVSATK
ncbi:MAG: squalene/phytoene synthase family protein [Candidatus Eremiobacteraeota bacterium]|nr:squalene/phytoene synthase family protein [Candidatus Eremiobacteraeota bacterium]